METVTTERDGGIVTVTMNRPHRKNAGTPQMWEALTEAFEEVARGDDRVLVLTGAGGDFCSGADLAGLEGDSLDYMSNAGKAAQSLHALHIPSIAKVDGVAVGAGWNLALGCDLVVATDRARFSQIFVKRALSIDMGGSWLLPRLVGLQKAKEIAFYGDIVSASEAFEMGLVTRMVAADQLDSTVHEMSKRLVQNPARALSLTKQLLDASAADSSFTNAVQRENFAQTVNFNGNDVTEAKAAFAEKRQPDYTQDSGASSALAPSVSIT